MNELRFPNRPLFPTAIAVFDDRELVSEFMAKCKRRRMVGPTPCYCCPGECVGEPRNAEEDARYCRDAEARLESVIMERARRQALWAWFSTSAVIAFVATFCLKGIVW